MCLGSQGYGEDEDALDWRAADSQNYGSPDMAARFLRLGREVSRIGVDSSLRTVSEVSKVGWDLSGMGWGLRSTREKGW